VKEDPVYYPKKAWQEQKFRFIYRSYNQRDPGSTKWIVHSGLVPIVFFSNDLESVSVMLQEIIGRKGTSIQKKSGYGDYIPSRYVVRKNKRIVAYLIDEGYHAIVLMKSLLAPYGTLRIASLETLDLFVFAWIFGGSKHEPLAEPAVCCATFCRALNCIRSAPYSRIPAFTVTCSGHQELCYTSP
jgi:hypothetical protein